MAGAVGFEPTISRFDVKCFTDKHLLTVEVIDEERKRVLLASPLKMVGCPGVEPG